LILQGPLFSLYILALRPPVGNLSRVPGGYGLFRRSDPLDRVRVFRVAIFAEYIFAEYQGEQARQVRKAPF
jgi:hypothetical protein